MAITERDRRQLDERLADKLGPSEADTMMELLPYASPDELVTITYFQTEMAAHRAQIHADFTEFKSEVRADFADLKTEVKRDVLRVENQLSFRIANLETSMARMHTTVMRWVVALGTANLAGVITAIAT